MPTIKMRYYSWCPCHGYHRHHTFEAARRFALRMERQVAKATNGPAPRGEWGSYFQGEHIPWRDAYAEANAEANA